MPRGSKDSYTGKQIRQAEHIEESYEAKGAPKDEAERRASATVNTLTGGGKKSGSGRKPAESSLPHHLCNDEDEKSDANTSSKKKV